MSGRRVVLADDDALLRQGLAALLEDAGYDVVGQAGNVDELSALMHGCRPDIAVIDVRMPPTNTVEGLEAAQAIRKEYPETGILILSAHADAGEALDLLAGGDRIGYLVKSHVTDIGELVDALDRIADGRCTIDAQVVRELLRNRRPNNPLVLLSPREQDVLRQLAEGRSNSGIAKQLFLSEGTVEKHVSSVFNKLGLEDTADDHRRVLAVLRFLDTT